MKTNASAGPQETCLHHLFERQVRRSPEALAVADPQTQLSYRELDRRAEMLASRLRSLGVRPNSTVGIYMERCADYVVACLAALKAGGAFLPLELAYPGSLLREVIAASGPVCILTRTPCEAPLPDEPPRISLDRCGESLATGAAARARVGPENLCFVAYSSGTTGKPKGIANPHRAAVRSYLWRFGISDCRPGDRIGSNVFFIWEVLRPLLRGATSYVIPDDVIYDPAALVGFLKEYGITETLATPSLLETVLNYSGPELGQRLPDLRTLWLNGEIVTKPLARRAMEALPDTRLLNVYSISETHEVAAGDLRELADSPYSTHCPVGRPMEPDRLYILDEDLRPVERGEDGELYVGGGCLAHGYVGLPETTAERFLKDPFAPGEGARMYRSGDRARLLPDGNLEILGRCDFMVKIRGYSIELGAVEAALEQHLAVRACVVTADGDEGKDRRLVAYLVPGEGHDAGWDIDPKTGRSPAIRRLLQRSLPHYAIPAAFVETNALPLQETTGKVDRERLPPPPPRVSRPARDPGERRLPADAPRQEKEALLARIWEYVLHLDEGTVDRQDGFFDIGGHSLAAAEMLSRVEETFGVRIPVSALLEHPTLDGFCGEIEAGQGGASRREDGPDLRLEATLEPGIAPRTGTTAAAITLGEARRVLLTGATGFLGAFLLDELLRRTDAEALCLVRARGGFSGSISSIRTNLERYGLWDPGHAARITPVAGDLSKPLLGLEGESFKKLAETADLVIHAGALVNLLYPYSALAPANVNGTREVLRLACLGKSKPLHHVSTNGIFPAGEGYCTEDTDLDSLADAREDGYGRSKWVAEKLVRQAAERGLPVCVYRPGNISGHSSSGASNPRDLLTALIAESVRLGSAPGPGEWRMEMTPVDFVSAAICEIASGSGNHGKVFHLANPDPPTAEQVFGRLEALGYNLERLDFSEWSRAQRAASGPRNGESSAGGVLRGAEAHDLDDGNTYDDRNTRQALAGSAIRRPGIDGRLLGNYARYFAGQGWIGAPPEPARSGGSR